jgi:RHS repeat-associated protein
MMPIRHAILWMQIVLAGCFSAIPMHGEEALFSGQMYSEESNLYFHRARYYDPETGTFLTKDPQGVADGPNQYPY